MRSCLRQQRCVYNKIDDSDIRHTSNVTRITSRLLKRGGVFRGRRRVTGAASRWRSGVALQERRRHHVNAGGVIMSWWRGCVTSKSTSVTSDGVVTAFYLVGTNEVVLVMFFGRFIFVGSAAEWMFYDPCRQSAVQLSHRIYMAYNNGITILPSVGLCMDYRCDSARDLSATIGCRMIRRCYFGLILWFYWTRLGLLEYLLVCTRNIGLFVTIMIRTVKLIDTFSLAPY